MARTALPLPVLLVPVLLLAGCAARADSGAPADDVVGEWELVSGTAAGSPVPQPAGARATLAFDGARAGGTSFCNSYSSGYTAGGGSVRLGEIGATEMGCEPDVMAAETAFLTALGTVATFALDGPELLLTGDGVELRFRPVPAVPTSALVGTDWVLESVLDGEAASSTVGGGSTLRLADDGTVVGSTACSRLSGRWQPTGDRVLFPELTAEPADCPEGARGQDAHELAVLRSGVTVTVEEDRLTVLADDGRGLVYRASR